MIVRVPGALHPGCVGTVTETEATEAADPPGFVAVIVYGVLTVGHTCRLPDSATFPIP